MRRSAFADAAAAGASGDWAHDSSVCASASSAEAQGLGALPAAALSASSSSFSKGGALLPSPPLPPRDTFDTPERRPPPESWLRRAWWRGAVSGAAAALALLALLALASSSEFGRSSPFSSAAPSASSASSASVLSRRAHHHHLRGGGFAPGSSFSPPRLLSNDERRALHPSRASKLGSEAAGTGARGAAAAADEAPFLSSASRLASSSSSSSGGGGNSNGRTLVSYAYFEKDGVQAANLAFFSAFGMGLATKEEKGGGGGGGQTGKKEGKEKKGRRRSPFLPPPPPATDFFVVVSGPTCTPCAMFSSLLAPDARARLPGAPLGISGAWSGVIGETTAEGGGGAERGPTTAATATAGTTTTATTVTLLHRFENDGMDFGAHNVTLEWLAFLEGRRRGSGDETGGEAGGELLEASTSATAASRHRRLIFLNSSARGPFLPNYLPEGWHWTDAFTRDLDEEEEMEREGAESKGETKSVDGGGGGGGEKETKNKKKRVALVGAALTCLPSVDAGGPGPRVESWAFALSRKGLALAAEAGVFGSHGCKLCADGVVVAGEYGLSLAVLRSGRNLATLMSRYGKGVDWSREEHWGCNDNVHPSRHATYDGVDMHPFETLFVKSSWHVGEPFVSAYSRWGARLAASSREEDGDSGDKDKDSDGDSDGDGETFSSSSFDAGTGGTFDEPRYRYAISPEAQEDWGVSECFGKGAPPLPEWRKKGKGKGKGKEKVDDGSWSEWWLQS